MSKKHVGGRPRKYTASTLRKGVEKYFASISRTVTAVERYNTREKDSWGHDIFEERDVLNDAGEKIRFTAYAVPPTVGGLCCFLEIHRSTWAEYCDAALHPELVDIVAWTRGRMQAWREEQLLVRKDVRGIMFDLQNNFGMTDKREIELGPRSSARLTTAGMTAAEKLEALKGIMRELGEGDESGQA